MLYVGACMLDLHARPRCKAGAAGRIQESGGERRREPRDSMRESDTQGATDAAAGQNFTENMTEGRG